MHVVSLYSPSKPLNHPETPFHLGNLTSSPDQTITSLVCSPPDVVFGDREGYSMQSVESALKLEILNAIWATQTSKTRNEARKVPKDMAP